MRRTTRYWWRWWAKRGFWYVCVPSLVLVGVRLYWGWDAARKLEAAQGELRASGMVAREQSARDFVAEDPLAPLVEALHHAGISEEERKLVLQEDRDVLTPEIDWPEADRPAVRAILARLGPTFNAVDETAKRPARLWHKREGIVEGLGDARQLASLTAAAAIMAHADGNDAESLHCIERIMEISRIVDGHGDLISHLVAIAIRMIGSQTVERLEPVLRLKRDDGSLGCAERLVRVLEDSKSVQDAAFQNFVGELAYVEWSIENEAPGLNDWWIRPLKSDVVGRMRTDFASQANGIKADTWPVAKALLHSNPTWTTDTNLDRLILLFLSDASYFWRAELLHFRAITDSSASAVLLAARMYHQQTGAYPKGLADLAPGILQSAPLDSFSPTRDTLRYRLDVEGPTVWSVSENRTDEGAPVKIGPSGKLRRYGDGASSQPDMVYGAAWRTAKPPPVPPGAPIAPGMAPFPETGPGTQPGGGG